MSSITTEQGILHYEVLGRGKPVILLHGWLGSWGLWQDTMTYLSEYYRTYALDFWGFGESGKNASSFTIQDFVKMVDQFIDHLGIQQAPLVGHSMGGTVSLATAVNSPKKVSKVVVIGSPIIGTSLAPLLKIAGRRWAAKIAYSTKWALKMGINLASPIVTRDSRWPEMMDRDLSKTTLESFLLSISSLRRTDLRPFLSQLQIPVMGMYGDNDVIVDPNQWKYLQSGVSEVQIHRFPSSGHFIMLDEPENFMHTLHNFLDAE